MSTCPFFNCACAFHPLRYHSLLQKTRPTRQEKTRSSQFQNTLELHDGMGALIASNDNWRTTIIGGIIHNKQVRDIQASGYAPRDGRESAIIADMPSGN
jgi:hypothetical protein